MTSHEPMMMKQLEVAWYSHDVKNVRKTNDYSSIAANVYTHEITRTCINFMQ
jgi:hypothetical protein